MNLRQFVRFVAAGGVAALVNFGSRIAFSTMMPYVPAIALAYCVGMATAFLLNRAFVFLDPINPLRHQLFWFTAINVAAVAQTIVISLLFARIIFPAMEMHFHPETVAHAIGVVFPVFTSYVGHSLLSFRKTRA